MILFINNNQVLIDDEDFEKISKYKWTTRKDKNGVIYAIRHEKGIIMMHRFVMNLALIENISESHRLIIKNKVLRKINFKNRGGMYYE